MGVDTPSLDILPNETTRLAKDYLYSYGKGRSSPEKLIDGLQQVLKKNPIHKYLVHLELFMHIKDPNVEEIHEHDEVPFDFIPYNYPGISKEFYCELVIKLGLHNQFLQMMSVMKGNEFFQGLVLSVIHQLFSKDNVELDSNSEEIYYGVPIDVWRLYLIHIAKYSKDKDSTVNRIYTELFKNLLEMYLTTQISRQEKLSMILRLAGIVCMKNSDYEDSTEIAELNRDWAFDPTKNLAKKSRETFSILYRRNDEPAGEAISKSVLDLIIDLLLNNDIFRLTDCDKSEWRSIYRTQHLSWLNYIGACSYLTHMIVVKYREEIGDSANVLLNAISGFLAFKPKITQEDFRGEIDNFDHFCELLSVYGNRERYQKKWFNEFLKFPEALTTINGVKLASQVISVSADFDVALELVNNAAEISFSKLNDRIKSMVINMLSLNKNVRDRKEEFVTQVYKNGIHSHFAKDEFVMDFNMLCTKLGSIENENDPKLQCYWEDIVYSICFQNPMVAAEGLLKQSIRINQFKALRIAKPFLVFETEEILTDKLVNIPIFQSCLFNIIHATEEYDPLFDHMVQSVPSLLEHDFIEFWIFHEFIIHMMGNVILKRKINKLYKLLLMYEKLLEYGIREKKISENSSRCYNFLDSLRIFTYAQAKLGALGVMLKVRDKVYELKVLMSENFHKDDNQALQIELTPVVEGEYGMLTLVELGALFARNANSRKSIIKFFENPDNFTRVSFSQLLKTVVALVFNSSNSEWEAVIKYILHVLLQFRPELNKLSPLYVMNESVYFAFSESKKDTLLFQRFLDFYTFFVKKLQSSPNLMAPLEQKSTIECLAGITVAMYEISYAKKDSKLFDNNIVRHILLMMLSLIDWMVLHNDDFDNIKKDLLIMVYSIRLPHGAGPCIPIHRSIISRIVKKKEAPLIALNYSENSPHSQSCEQMFQHYVSMKSNEVPEEMLVLEKDWDTRDTFEYKPPN